MAPMQLWRAEYASAMVQMDVWHQTCALSGPSPIVHAANVDDIHLKSTVQANMANQMMEELSNLCEE